MQTAFHRRLILYFELFYYRFGVCNILQVYTNSIPIVFFNGSKEMAINR